MIRPSAAVMSVLCAWSSPALAQGTAEAFLADTEHDDAIRLTTEMDPAIAFGVGYVHAVDLRMGSFERRLGAHLDTTAILGFSSWDLVGGVTAPFGDGVGLDALATTDLELKYVHNDVHSGVVYGYGASLRPGWFGRRVFVSADLALHGTIAATVHHSDAYRAMFPDVADGTSTTGYLSCFAGVASGVRIGRHGLLGLRVAWRFPGTFDDYAPYFVPYTAEVDVGMRF